MSTTAFCAGRAGLHGPFHHIRVSLRPSSQRFSSSSSFATRTPRTSRWWTFRSPPPPFSGRRPLLSKLAAAATLAGAGAGTLTSSTFAHIAEEDIHDGKTSEQHMLEASRAEIESALPELIAHTPAFTQRIWLFLDTYIWEPIATGLRFLHLVIIFVPVVGTIPLIWVGGRNPKRDNERWGTIWWYGFLVNSMERAGAAFIKLGQWAASRTDIFPKEMCSIMSEMHSNAPAHSLRMTKKTISAAFNGMSFDDIFEEFEEKPLGVGAIAQVYRAKLRPNLRAMGDSDVSEEPTFGARVKKNVDALAKSTPQRVPSSYVAIKVLHPGVDRMVQRDLRIMSAFAAIIDIVPGMGWFSFPDQVMQFGEMMKLQLDLRIEAANLSLFRKNFRDRTTAWFPYPYTAYISRQVLVEEFAHGIPLEDFLRNGGGVYQKEIADEGLDAFLHMLLIDNFVHADLHPGNIMVRFYKPAQIETPWPANLFTKSSTPTKAPPHSSSSPSGTDDAPSSAAIAADDVTEQVLQRLRPYRHDVAAWSAELTAIDREGYRPQLIFIDTGLVTELNEKNRANFLDLFKAVAEFDGYKAGQLMVARSRQPETVLDPEVFALRMQHLVLGVKSATFALGNIKIGDILSEVLDMVRSHHVRLEGDFVNVVLSILLLEGIGRTLDPNLDLFSGALPILRRLGTQGGSISMLRKGDFSMIKVWAGLEARKFITASVEEVDRCVKYDQLSPNI